MMNSDKIDRRISLRFRIPGATVDYSTTNGFFSLSNVKEEKCSLCDISRRGLQFQCHKRLKNKDKMTLKIFIPDDKNPLKIKGKVGSVIKKNEDEFKYLTSVQFNTYGERKGQNSPASLVKIIALEQKYSGSDIEK